MAESPEILLARLDERGERNRADIQELVATVRPLPAKLDTLDLALRNHMADEQRQREADSKRVDDLTATIVAARAERATRRGQLFVFAGVVLTALVSLIGIFVRGAAG